MNERILPPSDRIKLQGWRKIFHGWVEVPLLRLADTVSSIVPPGKGPEDFGTNSLSDPCKTDSPLEDDIILKR